MTSHRPSSSRVARVGTRASTVALPLALAAALPGAAGAAVAPAQIVGDGFPALDRSAKPVDRGGAVDGIPVPIRGGDGVQPLWTGSKRLVGGGTGFFVNDDITFSTTSSASGAMSEASFAAPRDDVSTAGGGTTSEQLNDAFDGYNALAVQVGDDAPAYDGDGRSGTYGASATWYSGNGAGTLVCDNREVSLNPQTIGDLRVTRRVWVPAGRSIARHLNIVTNTGTAPQTVTLGIHNNLGSDSSTKITGSASGDDTVTVDDGWYGSMQSFSGATSSDPRLGFVLAGPGGPTLHEVERAVNGDDNPYWSYRLTVPPGETRIVANYVVVEANVALANGTAAELSASPRTDCMSDDEVAQLVNFDLAPPMLDLPDEVRAVATSAVGASVTFTATATDLADGDVPVSCAPASGSLFPVGTTTVTCTAVDAAGNTVSGSFPVTVSAPPEPPAPPVPEAPAPSAAPAPPPSVAPKACASSRVFRIRVDGKVRPRDRNGIRRAVVTLDGKRLTVRERFGRRTVLVDLRGRSRGEARVRAQITLANGRTVREVRVYHPCTPGKRT